MCCAAFGGAAHALLSSPGRGARRAIFVPMTIVGNYVDWTLAPHPGCLGHETLLEYLNKMESCDTREIPPRLSNMLVGQ